MLPHDGMVQEMLQSNKVSWAEDGVTGGDTEAPFLQEIMKCSPALTLRTLSTLLSLRSSFPGWIQLFLPHLDVARPLHPLLLQPREPSSAQDLLFRCLALGGQSPRGHLTYQDTSENTRRVAYSLYFY